MQELIFSLTIIITGLVLGYIGQKIAKKMSSDHENSILFIRKLLQKIGLLFLMPVSFVAAVWIVSFEDIRITLLPLIGAFALLLGGALGLIMASFTKNGEKQRGEFFCCGSFTNLGSLGALITFVFLGEAGFGLIALYMLFENTVYYTIGLPIIKYYSGAENEGTFRQRIMEIGRDPFVLAAMVALTCGLSLNLSGISRPIIFESVNNYLVPAGTFILLISIGLGMRFSRVAEYFVEGVLISLIKFIAVPFVTATLAYSMGFGGINNGLPLKVVLIASSMPVAFAGLVVASVYDLDLNFANSCWLITTAALIIVIPWLYFLITIL